MKRVAVLFFSIVLITLLLSCEKETLLSVDQTSINISDAGGSSTVSLTANKPWTANSNQSWCKVSPSSGEEATSSRITISCDPNTTYDARNATVTFTCAELTKQVSITQTMNNGLMVTQTSYELTKAAQQLNIEVKANVKFSVEVDSGCKDWVKYNTTKGLTTSTVVLDIAENKSYDGREGKVTIKQDGGSLSSTVTIKQSQLDGLFLTTSEYNLSNEKHTLTVEVSTNVEFDVKPEADWVKYVQTKGLSTKQIVLEVAANDTYDQRETKVNVKQKNGDLSGTITIKQDEKYGILVSQSEYTLTNEAQAIDVEVKYNVDFDVSIPDDCKDWIKQISTKGLSTKNYSFSIAKNETYDNREGSITFKQKKGSLSGTVAIKQAQTDYLEVAKNDFTVDIEGETITIEVTSNVDYTVSISEDAQSWLSIVETKGLSKDYMQIAVSAGDDNTDRKGEIVICYGDLKQKITVHQYSYAAKTFIHFADANFKAHCVSTFDWDYDGEISIIEASNIYNLSVMTVDIKSLQGIEFMPNLTVLHCYGGDMGGQLTSLDVSQNTALAYLDCSDNQLTSLDLSNNIALTYLRCKNNHMTHLDVSNNSALSSLYCNNNAPDMVISIRNGQIFKDFEYDKTASIVETGDPIPHGNVSFTDPKFKAYCNQFDIDKDGEISFAEALLITGISCNNYGGISSLGGIEFFTNLQFLNCNDNRLTSLDVSHNTSLMTLTCINNQLTSLDVSKNQALQTLDCGDNPLTGLDVSKNQALQHLYCQHIPLTSLDVSKNPALQTLNCRQNQLTSLDVSKNPALQVLYCGDNPLMSLDVSKNPALQTLDCYNNQLTSLDVSNNIALKYLGCYANQLKILDVSNNSTLRELNCVNNAPDIVVIRLYGQGITINRDWTASIVITGDPIPHGNVSFTDPTFKAYCVSQFDIDNNGEISYAEAFLIRSVNCSNMNISSLAGIEFFTNLECLYCGQNQLTSLDVSKNTALTSLNCEQNQLTSLDVSKNTILSSLCCYNNQTAMEILLKKGQDQTIVDFQHDASAIIRFID